PPLGCHRARAGRAGSPAGGLPETSAGVAPPTGGSLRTSRTLVRRRLPPGPAARARAGEATAARTAPEGTGETEGKERAMNEETLFHRALEKPPGERAAFLDRACAGDAALRQRVEVLLRAHDDPGSFLTPPALEGPSEAKTLPPDEHPPAGPGLG